MLDQSVTAEAPERPGEGSGLIGVGGGRRLFARWTGVGRAGLGNDVPVVVLEAGLGDTHASWDPVLEQIAAFAPVLAYDRAGRGQSDPRAFLDLPWTGADIADDLMRLVRALNIDRRVVVVGHSFGGLVARLLAERYPGAVTGVVLVDASHEDAHEGYLTLLEGEARAEYARRIASNPEGIDFAATCDQVRASRAPHGAGRPLAVVARGARGDAPPGWPPEEELMAMWLGLQRRLAALSPTARFILAEHSGHYIHRDQPDLVVEAVRQSVIDAARWTP